MLPIFGDFCVKKKSWHFDNKRFVSTKGYTFIRDEFLFYRG